MATMKAATILGKGQIRPWTPTRRIAAMALVFAYACAKEDGAAPTAQDHAQAVQHTLAFPANAASAPPADAVRADIATPAPSHPSAALVDADTSMVRLLGVPPTLTSTSKPIHEGAAPHLFHLGAASFFLDHEELSLTVEQRSKLSAIRETAVLGYATVQRKIDQAEQDLWTLTSAKHPYASQVEAKLTEIAGLSTQQRMDYIRAIGEAVAQLTKVQHELLATAPMGTPSAMPMPTDNTPPTSGSSVDAMPMVEPSPAMPVEAKKPMGHM